MPVKPHGLAPLRRWRNRRRISAQVSLDPQTITGLLTRLSCHPQAPADEQFWHDLGFRIYAATAAQEAACPSRIRAILRWCEAREDPRLLREALAAGLTTSEIWAHLEGTLPLDPETVAALAAWATAEEDTRLRFAWRLRATTATLQT
jgi:hypothetical protein